jgi:hypothetical protein
MANISVLDDVTEPITSISSYPRRSLACLAILIALASGWFAALHLLGTLNLLFGIPLITGTTVIPAALTGMILSAFVLNRFGLIHLPETAPMGLAAIPRTLVIVLVLAAIPYTALFLSSFWSFPNGTDAIAYHINVALKWLQNGSFRIDPALGWEYSLPGNAELPALFALAAGVEKAAAIGNLFACILLGTSVYLIGCKITRQMSPSILSAVVAVTIPFVVYQTFELYVDLFGSAFVISAIALLIWRDKSPKLFTFLSGCALGVAVGTKPTFWAYGAIYGVTALAILWHTKALRPRYVALLLAGIVLTCGFWFLRAALVNGDPLYPVLVPMANKGASAGYSPTSIMRVKSPRYDFAALFDVVRQLWTEPLPNPGRVPYGSDRGTGPLFPTLAVPGLIFLLIRTIRRRVFSLEAVLLLANVAMFLFWVVGLRMARFGLPVLAMACALSAPMLTELLARSRLVLLFLCLVCLTLNAFYCVALPAQRLVRQFQRHDWSRARYYGYPPIIDHLPPGSRIIDHAGYFWSSMLAGVNLTNSVQDRGELRSGDYILKAGPRENEDVCLRSEGARVIFDGTPRNLYPKVQLPWRIYRLP